MARVFIFLAIVSLFIAAFPSFNVAPSTKAVYSEFTVNENVRKDKLP